VPARIGIFAMTAILYTWHLSRVDMGNTFYAAAVKSGTESWKAFFFGSLDPGSFITVDKPPAALWVMELSGRIFGFSSWSMLLPEAIAGLLSVMVIYHVVRRWAGEIAAVIAALALALTPVAVVIFRYNDPDAFLTLMLVLAGWAMWSALESAKTSRLILSFALVGLAFLTKTLDAFIVVPALAGAYLWCGKPRLRRRLMQLVYGAVALIVSSAWWFVIVELWPASSRPYIGGSTNNTEWNLIFGYNGFARIFGSSSTGGGATSTTASNFGGGEGVLRMFDSALGGQISWLIPLALVGFVGGLWLTRRHNRTSLHRAGYVLWGGTLFMFMAVYDDAKGIFHPYYTVVMAPAIAALAGAGVVALWKLGQRSRLWSWVLPATLVGSAIWASHLLSETSNYYPGLGTGIVVAASISALAILLLQLKVIRGHWLALMAGVVAAVSLLAGPTAYSLTTTNSTSNGIATAGPSTGQSGGLGGGAGGGFGGSSGGGGFGGKSGGPPSSTSSSSGTTRASGQGFPGSTGAAGLSRSSSLKTKSSIELSGPSKAHAAGGTSGSSTSGFPLASGRASSAMGGGAMGGGASVSSSLVRYLERHQGSATYLVAVVGSQEAAPYILQTGKAVVAIGGFSGSDPAPTLHEFLQMVASGKLHYVYESGSGSGGGGTPGAGGGGSSTTAASAIDQWLTKHATVVSSSSYGTSSSSGTLYYVSSAKAAAAL
jgi:4-amino-4-deoxy-L-arabinose transferase-like glycosyltransferase